MSGRILIAAGPTTASMALEERLRDAFLETTTELDGRAALRTAQTAEPDLLIADARAPIMSGLALCRAFKTDRRLAHVPVILVGGREAASRLAGLEAGADDFLSPPVGEEALLARLRSLLRMKAMSDELRLREETARTLGLPVGPQNWDAPPLVPAELLIAMANPACARRRGAQIGAALGVHVRLAADAREAVEAAHAAPPDLVLIEPGADPASQEAALRLIATLRSRPATRSAGIVVTLSDSAASAGCLALDLGANDCVTAPAELAEMVARLRTQLRRKRFSDQLRDAVRDGLMMAATDALTGLYNRRYAETHLARMMGQCARAGQPLAVMLLDLDHFKNINDRHGHPAGDAVLRGFAERLKAEVRGADLVARLGGEEFCVAMPGADEEVARNAAERVRRAVAGTPFPTPAGLLPVTVSIGVAVTRPHEGGATGAPTLAFATPAGFAEDGPPALRRPRSADLHPTGASLLARADGALYASKEKGRDRVSLAG